MGTIGTSLDIFVVSVWWAWRNRNSMCFTIEHVPYYCLIMEAQEMSQIFFSCFSNHSSGTSEEHLVKWNASNISCTILNIDGSCLMDIPYVRFWRSSSKFWRSLHLRFLCIYWRWIYWYTLYAKLLVIYHGLSLAKDLGHDHIACYSDSLKFK
jgi:hypothetical protein